MKMEKRYKSVTVERIVHSIDEMAPTAFDPGTSFTDFWHNIIKLKKNDEVVNAIITRKSHLLLFHNPISVPPTYILFSCK